jgi:serine/threonine protein kinase
LWETIDHGFDGAVEDRVMKEGELLAGRYEIRRRLGAGTAAATFRALDRQDGSEVVVKLLSLGEVSNWKTVELFQREAGVLKCLRISGVPAYRDFFSDDSNGGHRLILVQEYIGGETLLRKVELGWRASEDEILRIGAGILRIVSAIHSVRPPIIHRDINPKNVILRDDGEVFLVDFGGVQDAVRVSTSLGSTVVGTAGYTPMEQFVGRATVRSDLFAVAATLVFLLTHRNPADLPARNMKIDVAAVVPVASPGLARVLDSYLEPDEEKRNLPEDDAIALLEGREPSTAASVAIPAHAGPPQGSRISVGGQAGRVSFLVPERGRGAGAAAGGAFSLFWLGFVAFWTFSAISMGAPVVFPLFSVPFWATGLFMAYRALFGLFGRTQIEVDRETVTITRGLFFWKRRSGFPVSEVGECSVQERQGRRGSSRYCILEAGTRSYRFGVYLSERERQWLASAINGALEGSTGASMKPKSRKGKE